MTTKIEIVGANPKKIVILDKPQRRIDPAELGAALGAKPIGQPHGTLDLIDLAELGIHIIHARYSQSG